MRRFWTSLWAAALLGDVLSTWVAINRFGMSEGNPIAAWLFTTLGFWTTVVLQVAPWALILGGVHLRGSSIAATAFRVGSMFAICIRLLVVTHNVLLIGAAA